jgi:hypothetical protein
VRIALAPTLRTRPVAAYAAVYLALLLVVVWGPTPATRQLPYILAFIVLLAVGVDVLRRQTAREFPDAQDGETIGSIRVLYGRGSDPRPTSIPAPRNGGRVAELERLSRLHAVGSLTDAEFASEKALVMNGR